MRHGLWAAALAMTALVAAASAAQAQTVVATAAIRPSAVPAPPATPSALAAISAPSSTPDPTGTSRSTSGQSRAEASASATATPSASAETAAQVATATTAAPTPPPSSTPIPNLRPIADSSGTVSTFSKTGSIDTNNDFFQSLGTNGRSCSTCHVFSDGWTLNAQHVQQRFNASQGLDPLFRTVDGANAPNLDVSTVDARRAAYSMLLSKGVIRIGLPVPPNAEFTLAGVNDPYHYASASELSLFRRPLPATNLSFLSAIMWDGREPSLASQANDATLGHAQANSPLTDEEQNAIVAFETANFTAQAADRKAGDLTSAGAQGGAQDLANQTFFIGINDPLGNNPTGANFTPNVFTDYQAWLNSPDPAKQSVARGEALFNTKSFAVTGVAGLNDALNQPSITGTCSLCHDAINVGDHSVKAPLNIGVADASGHSGLDTSGLPVYTLKCNTTGAVVQTTDPGRAMISGKCADIGKFKGPILRGLASRAPYFHNGSGTTLADVVKFYNGRFNIGFTSPEMTDLVNFLQTL